MSSINVKLSHKLPRKIKKTVFGKAYNHHFAPRATPRTYRFWYRYVKFRAKQYSDYDASLSHI